MEKIKIGNKIIDKNFKPFIIAEAGVNYYDIAKSKGVSVLKAAELMIKEAASAGADAIKFQIYKAGSLASKYSPSYWDTSKEKTKSQYELFKKFDKLSDDDYHKLASYAGKQKIIFMATPFDEEAIELVNKLSPVFKVASADITNLPFLKLISRKKKPIFLSVGASTIKEIKEAVDTIEREGNSQIVLLHCVLNYPTGYYHANLHRIEKLKEAFPGYFIGYSDHTLPDEKMLVLSAASMLGAVVIEKHFTLDKNLKGNDHYHAMDASDLQKFIRNISFLKKIIGDNSISEQKYLKNQISAIKNARRSIVAATGLKKGDKVLLEDVLIKRPGTGISPKYLEKIIGMELKKDVKEDETLNWKHFV